jgi:hypothetical protein
MIGTDWILLVVLDSVCKGFSLGLSLQSLDLSIETTPHEFGPRTDTGPGSEGPKKRLDLIDSDPSTDDDGISEDLRGRRINFQRHFKT